MARILRGETYWTNLDPTQGHEQADTRPILVLSHAVFNQASETVITVAVTSQEPRSGFPLTLGVAGLPKRSWVKIGQIRTLSPLRLGTKLGKASASELAETIQSLNEIIGT